MSDPVVSVEHLTHKYGERSALVDLTFSLKPGGIIGLLGANGAGKSTLMNILCGCLSHTTGEVSVAGFNPRQDGIEMRRRIGFLPQQAPLHVDLTVCEYLSFCAGLRGVPPSDREKAVDTVCQQCALTDVARRLIGNLSGGYRQRVGIAQAIIHKPHLVVLDEPTVGLDPNQIEILRELIRSLSAEHTIIFSTHIMSEVDLLCKSVLMINNGKIVFDNTIDNFKSITSSNSVIVTVKNAGDISVILNGMSGVMAVEPISANQFVVRFDTAGPNIDELASKISSYGWGLGEIYYQKASLEDAFKQLSGAR